MIIRLIFIVITTLYLSGCEFGSVFGSHVSDTDYSIQNEEIVTPNDGLNTAIVSAPSTNRLAFGMDKSSIIALADSYTLASPSGDWELTSPSIATTVSLSSSASSVYDNGSNITITATATQVTQEDITVVIGTSGSATEGTDAFSLAGSSSNTRFAAL